MESRHVHGTQRRPPPSRSVSSTHLPTLPSRLSNLRSVSHAANLTTDASRSADIRNTASFLGNREALFAEPQVIDLQDEEDEPPAKRARTGGHALPRADGDPVDDDNDSARRRVPGSPLPPLRKQNASAGKHTSQKPRSSTVSRTARRANGLEPPPVAVRLPAPRLVADFHPWNGHHPEDQMSETVVKAGYFDKPPAPNSTESNSAKPTIWPNLSQKNNMGLQTLSYLFTSVMEKRQAMGKCTAPSTFKPPPRVTVTDTKREAWLRDLANPDVPLRKQSRTIPHGIRGKLLMEQCLGKDIPMPRAVWLAKCVGANELRAFRRKGVSGAAAATGEQKWIRDWTIAVEQFVDGVVAACGQQPEWQSRMDYAVKLATSFYSERLLERDHYLDWVVTSFAQAPVDRLPIWVISIQLYWRDVTAFGRRGRRLAEAVLETLHRINVGSVKVNDSLRDRLRKLVMVMAVTNRGCLILPLTWEKYRYILAPKSLPTAYASVVSPAHDLAKRNDRLSGPLNKTSENTRSAVLELFSALDNAGLSNSIEELVSKCSAKVSNMHTLITALLEWSSSVYRTGVSRIYLASRLIAQLARSGADVDAIVLDFLKASSPAKLITENAHRAIGELIRLGRFSTGRYLQWLMVSGMLSNGDEFRLATGLLAALPLDALPGHLENTRKMLSRRLGYVEDDRLRAQDLAKNIYVYSSDNLATELDSLSVSGRLVFAHQAVRDLIDWRGTGDAIITVPGFCLLRGGLERANDIPALADALMCAAQTQDTLLLANIADTVNMHARSFAAMGRLRDMTIVLLGRYKSLRAQQNLDRTCILSIQGIVSQIPDMAPDVQLLDHDLVICETQNTTAACSPASDSLVSMSASHLDSDQDIDRVFDSGNTMDEQLMQRLFSRIVQRAGKSPQNPVLVPSKICQWLNKLRALDTPGFDELVKNYICTGLKNVSAETSNMLCKVVSALMASMGISLITVLRSAAKEAQSPLAAAVVLRLLTSDTIISEGLHESERYRFQALRQLSRTPKMGIDIVPLLILAMMENDLNMDDDNFRSLMLERSDLFVACVTVCTDNAKRSATSLRNCQRMMDRVLGIDGKVQDATSLVTRADPLSIVFCGAALSFHSSIGKQAAVNEELQHAMLMAIKSGSEVWPQLLRAAGPTAVNDIYQWAREQVVGSIAQLDVSAIPVDLARSLDILAVAFHAVKDDDGSTMLTMIVDHLRILAMNDMNELQLQILLHLSTLYGTSTASSTNELRLSLLSTLCTLLAHPVLKDQASMLEYIHDVASAISDTIPSDLLPLSRTHHDPRLSFILGSTPSPDAWLALATNTQQPQGMTQQQRALMKQQVGRQMAPQSPISQQAPKAGAVRVPFPLRRWEIMPDATPTMGENDTSLSLGLFGARRV